ncbi:MAG: ArsA family ATPase [Candidatus Binatia bacterium]|nr:ArsA family ATPase [Candidatus Binatia bacterium]
MITPYRRVPILERRLWVIVGKGGVGKTTVSVLFALWAATQGKRVLVAEVDGAGRAAWLLGVEPGPLGTAREVRSNLAVMSVEGSAALAEYLRLILPVRRVLDVVFSSRIYQYFVAAAPGLKELMTVGKIWYEAERIDPEAGHRVWDLVVMDAPATGHSLQYLRMPQAAREVFPSGLVGRESARLMELLSDPARTAVHIVTTAEEMPVNESIEMYQRIHSELQLPLGYLVVNRLHCRRFELQQLQLFRTATGQLPEKQRVIAEAVLDRAIEEEGWSVIHHEHLARLQAHIDLPRLELPFVFAEEFGSRHLEQLLSVLSAQLSKHEEKAQGHGVRIG